MAPGSSRRFVLLLLLASSFLSFTFVYMFRNQKVGAGVYDTFADTPIHHVDVSADTLHGEVIMPKLGNETLKAELGRAAWKVLHTTMSRFPDKPTEDESTALRSYIHLFARLYPCGECAGHFRKILTKYPPQVDTRNTAAAWACHVHNEVNKSLKKKLFDCSKIGDFYDCGCGDDDKKKDKEKGAREEGHSGSGHGSASSIKLELHKEGLTKGG